MKDPLLTVTIYSVVAFIMLLIFGLILFFKLRKNEREIRVIKRNLDALLQSSGPNWKGRPYQQKEDSYSIQDSAVNDQDQLDDTEDMEFIKDTLQHSKSHVSTTTNSINKEVAPEIVPENAKNSAEQADLKNKLLEMLYQYDKPISYGDFAKLLNENDSFAGKHNLVFDLIDKLAEEKIIEVGFVGGNLVIDPKKS